MRTIFPLLVMMLLLSCGSGSNQSETTTQTDMASSEAHGSAPKITGPVGATPFVLEGCYEMTMQRDTAQLTMQVNDTLVSGTLRYDWEKKDGNTGTIEGVLRDSLIVADYTFESEGLISVREVIFKISGTTLLQGFGDLEDRNGKIVFQNQAQLQYINEHPFVKVPCP